MSKLGDIVRERRIAKGLSQKELAKLVGMAQPSITNIEAERQTERPRKLHELMAVLEIPRDQINKLLNLETGNEWNRLANLESGDNESKGTTPMLTVYYSRFDSDTQGMLLSDKFEKVAGPLSLAEVEDAYGVQVSGTSMEPAYNPGETAFVHPYAALAPGCDILLRKPDPDRLALIRKLIAETDTEWKVHQYNPEEDAILLKEEWPLAEKIVGKYNRQ